MSSYPIKKSKIRTTNRTREGKIKRSKQIKVGECLFPFHHKGKNHTTCMPDKFGFYCPTGPRSEKGKTGGWKDGVFYKPWYYAYCETDDMPQIQPKIQPKKTKRKSRPLKPKKKKTKKKRKIVILDSSSMSSSSPVYIKKVRKKPPQKPKVLTPLTDVKYQKVWDVDKQGVMLAHTFKDPKTGKIKNPPKGYPRAPNGWYASEKYDGYRALWDGKDFRSRTGKIFHVPTWFKAFMPPGIALDGELFLGRECFERCGIFRRKKPNDTEWLELNVKYQVFDIPTHPGLFEDRMEYLKQLIKYQCKIAKHNKNIPSSIKCPLLFTEQLQVFTEKEVYSLFDSLVKSGAEGLMLRAPNSPYEPKRTALLLKVKPSFDEECRIIGYKKGTGKYKDLLGSFRCEMVKKPGITFDISGMTDAVRKNYRETHPIGTIVTFTFMGYTERGIPRHPRYLRIRTDMSIAKQPKKSKQPKQSLYKKIKPKKSKQLKPKQPKKSKHRKKMSNKELIIRELEVMKKKAIADKSTFKIIAYSKAMKSLKEHFMYEDIHSVEDVVGIPNIGKSIRAKIREILETGKLEIAEQIRNDPEVLLINKINEIYGIGPTKAKSLVKEHHVRSIEELRLRQDELLNNTQKKGLKYLEHISKRIPRKEMTKHNDFIQDVISVVDKKAKAIMVGSYLRDHTDSGDIDILITHKDNSAQSYKAFVKALVDVEYITEILSYGNKKFAGMVQLKGHKYHRRIDILYTTQEEYPFALLYFTGSGRFNTAVRKIATTLGYKLNEKGIVDITTKRKMDIIRTEKDIFDLLGIKYLAPNKREPENIVLL